MPIYRRMTAIFAILPVSTLLILVNCMAAPTHAMSVRDILYLNKYGEGISDVSWCNDQSLTFITHGPAHNTLFPPDYSRDTTVNMFTVETEKIRPVIVSEHAGFDADCVRNGEYAFLTGDLYAAMAKDARSPAKTAFSQFINVQSGAALQLATPFSLGSEDYVFFGNPMRTASDGSVYATSSIGALDLDSVVPSRRASVIKNGQDYSLTRDGVQITFLTTAPNGSQPGPFPVYVFYAPELWGFGSYDCPASRPGCTADASGPRVGYYLYAKVNTERARLDLAYTVTPGREPLLQRWPVVAQPGISSNTLSISGVALDSKHCYVLLEPNPSLAVNRVNGQLRLDLYLARCRFTANQLQFDQPWTVGRKQASFIFPKLALHGEFAVITETADLASQEDDQVELEKAASSRRNVCARFYRIATWPVAPVNAICARLTQDGAEEGMTVSPGGGYVVFRSKGNPIIVGREYRNDGTGPAWLNHGEQP